MSLTLTTIIGAGILDSINPCAIAVIIFLLSYLASLKIKKKVFWVGLVYIVTVYLTYFLAGVGLLTALASIKITLTIYYLAGALLIFLGLLDIKDFFWEGKGFSLKIPEGRKESIQKYVKKASLPSAIILGFLVSAFELPCTGGVYLAILTMLANLNLKIQGILYLLIYNLFFVLPLLIIWLMFYFGYSSNKVNQWRLKNRKKLKLIMGIGMIALGLLIVFQVL